MVAQTGNVDELQTFLPKGEGGDAVSFLSQRLLEHRRILVAVLVIRNLPRSAVDIDDRVTMVVKPAGHSQADGIAVCHL